MPTAIDATVGGGSSNSYVAVAAADTYFGDRPNSAAWTALVADDKIRALIAATDRLDQERYKGSKASPGQRLKWPRTGVSDDDGSTISDAIIPREVQSAQMELVLEMARAGTTDIFAPTGLEAFKSLSAGSVSLELRDTVPEPKAGEPATSAALQRWNLPPQVQRLLRHFLLTDAPLNNPTGTVRLVRS